MSCHIFTISTKHQVRFRARISWHQKLPMWAPAAISSIAPVAWAPKRDNTGFKYLWPFHTFSLFRLALEILAKLFLLGYTMITTEHPSWPTDVPWVSNDSLWLSWYSLRFHDSSMTLSWLGHDSTDVPWHSIRITIKAVHTSPLQDRLDQHGTKSHSFLCDLKFLTSVKANTINW